MFRSDHTLYPYQSEAVDTMATNNTLLAFDMGTGKTPTTLAAIEDLRQEESLNALILTPNSVKWQWAHEIAKFTDQDCVVIEGTPAKRAKVYTDMNDYPPPYLVMTYGTFMRDFEYLPRIDVMVLDEATAIKGFKSQRSKRVKRFAKDVPVRFALTGTPIENGRLEELFSILEFVNPRLLGKWWTFEKRYIVRNQMGWIERYQNVDQLPRSHQQGDAATNPRRPRGRQVPARRHQARPHHGPVQDVLTASVRPHRGRGSVGPGCHGGQTWDSGIRSTSLPSTDAAPQMHDQERA